jgi:hypothetical protein
LYKRKGKRTVEMVSVRQTEKIIELKDFFLDLIVGVNELERMSLAEEVKPATVGYYAGRMFSAVKEILKMLELEINLGDNNDSKQ